MAKGFVCREVRQSWKKSRSQCCCHSIFLVFLFWVGSMRDGDCRSQLLSATVSFFIRPPGVTKVRYFLLVLVLQQHSHGRLRFDIGISGLNFTDELTFY